VGGQERANSIRAKESKVLRIGLQTRDANISNDIHVVPFLSCLMLGHWIISRLPQTESRRSGEHHPCLQLHPSHPFDLIPLVVPSWLRNMPRHVLCAIRVHSGRRLQRCHLRCDARPRCALQQPSLRQRDVVLGLRIAARNVGRRLGSRCRDAIMGVLCVEIAVAILEFGTRGNVVLVGVAWK
jgi:hypothetical protein